jgi:hypothetical protein
MFRFTIRDVLWLTVVVGLACGWWMEHRQAVFQTFIFTRDERNLTDALRRAQFAQQRWEQEVDIMGKLLARKQQEIDELQKDRLAK